MDGMGRGGSSRARDGAASPRQRGIAYIRVSKGREEMISPEIQESAIRVFAERERIDLVDVVVDLDVSGRAFGKRKVAQIIDRIGAGEAEVVLLFKWSRFGRNLMHSLVNLELLKEAGGRARAATEDFDDATTMGKYSRDQLLLIYELQSNQIGDGWKDVHAHRRKRGLPHNGAARFGYRYERGVFVPDPVTGPLLAECYRRWLAGVTLRALALDLQARGVRSVRGNPIAPATLLGAMDTGFAAGYLRSGTGRGAAFDTFTKGAQEPLIDEATWQAFRVRRAKVAATPARLRTAKYPLSGLVFCGECGGRMAAGCSQRGSGHIWRCVRAKDFKTCRGASGSHDVVDRLVFEWVQAHARGEDDASVMLAQKASVRKALTDVRGYEAEIERLLAKRARLADRYTDDEIDRADYLAQKEQIAQRLAVADAALTAAREEADVNGVPAREVFVGLVAAWELLDAATKREALSKVIARVVIRQGGKARPDKYEIIARWDNRAAA